MATSDTVPLDKQLVVNEAMGESLAPTFDVDHHDLATGPAELSASSSPSLTPQPLGLANAEALPQELEARSSSASPSDEELPQSVAAPVPNVLRSRVTTAGGFREAKIAFAVDVSGSTYGAGLQAEIRAVRDICSLLPLAARRETEILPWSDFAHRRTNLDGLDDLDPDGGTKPSVIIDDPDCRFALQESSFWFLMTDGDILGPDVRQFARGLVEYGLHGLACVVATFGEKEQPPAYCNVSVGLSVFAVSPHCAFLYTDTATYETYVLQTKGCFSALLPKGKSNPALHQGTLWTDLPRTSYENLARIRIPSRQSVGIDEVILSDNKRVNISELLSSKDVDMNVANQIFDSEDNVKTIALTAKLRGQAEQLRTWLDAVEKTYEEQHISATTSQPETGQQLSSLFTDALTQLLASDATDRPQSYIPPNVDNSSTRLDQLSEETIKIAQKASYGRIPSTTIAEPQRRRSSGIEHCRRVSYGSTVSAIDNIRAIDYAPPVDSSGRYTKPSYHPRLQDTMPTPSVSRNESFDSGLAIPGFNKPQFQKDYFRGTCNQCFSEQNVLVLLLRDPPDKSQTVNFPLPLSLSKLIYPLTMGNYPETDIISTMICCDVCGARLMRRGKSSAGEGLTAALPLVSFKKNQAAWLQTVSTATGKRFAINDLPLVFLSIMYTKLERLLDEDPSDTVFTLRLGLEWACATLLREVWTADLQGHQPSPMQDMARPLADDILETFRIAMEGNSPATLLEYPLDGFIVANVALSNTRHKQRFSVAKRRRIVFFRFLYYLAEQYELVASESGELVLEALKLHMLVLDDPNAPRSLLNLERVRQISVIDAKDLLMTLRSRWGARRDPKSKSQKLSISVRDLLKTPLLDEETLHVFKRLGGLFSWIEDQTGHAIAVFLHYLFCLETPVIKASVRFGTIKNTPEVSEVIINPGNVSAKMAEGLIEQVHPALMIRKER